MTSSKPTAGARRPLSLIALELDSAEEAIELAKKLAQRSGRSITVQTDTGEVLAIVHGAQLN